MKTFALLLLATFALTCGSDEHLALDQDAGVHKMGALFNGSGQTAQVVGGYGQLPPWKPFDPYPNAALYDQQGYAGPQWIGPSYSLVSAANTPNQNYNVDGGGRFRVWCATAGAWIGYATNVMTDGGTWWDGGPVALTPGYAYWDAGLPDSGSYGIVICPTCWTDGGTAWDGGPIALTPGYAYWDGGWADAGIGAATPATPLTTNPEIWNLGVTSGANVIEIYSTSAETCYLTPLWAPQL